MANTNVLKYEIEPELIRSFFKTYSHVSALYPNPDKIVLKNIFLDMEPDLVGADSISSTLYIGEITTSGYLGGRGRDFHIGAVKKVFEAFSKFYLFTHNKNEILQRLSKYYPDLQLNNISCHFIVPAGSAFIKSLGYRRRLFDVSIMKLDELLLPDEIRNMMIDTLKSSRQEMSS